METTVILLCLLFIIIIFGVIVVFLLIYFNDNGRKKDADAKVYCSATSYGRGWQIEFYDETTGQVFSKRFAGQILVGRDNGSTELFWQMYVGQDRTISREQCVIYDNGGNLIVENKSRTNVTQLNGYPVIVPYILNENCRLGMGQRNFYITKLQKLA